MGGLIVPKSSPTTENTQGDLDISPPILFRHGRLDKYFEIFQGESSLFPIHNNELKPFSVKLVTTEEPRATSVTHFNI